MTAILYTENPQLLRAEIIKKIKKQEIKTWGIETIENEEYLIHKPNDDNWDNVFVKLIPQEKRLIIILDKNEEENINKGNYVLGRLTEVLLSNFSDKFTCLQYITQEDIVYEIIGNVIENLFEELKKLEKHSK